MYVCIVHVGMLVCVCGYMCSMRMCMLVCVCVCICVCLCVHACMYVCDRCAPVFCIALLCMLSSFIPRGESHVVGT